MTISNDCEADVYSIIWVQGALPVELASFTAKLQDKDKVAVEWSTATEVNFDYFELERSTDLRLYTTVATISGNNSLSKSNYEWIDRFPKTGESYYRLKQVDMDGSFVYSDWVNVLIHSKAQALNIYPVPARDKLFVVSGSVAIESLVVYDVRGERILEKQDVAGKMEIDVSEWGSGVYFLELQIDGERLFERFSKM